MTRMTAQERLDAVEKRLKATERKVTGETILAFIYANDVRALLNELRKRPAIGTQGTDE